MSKCSCYHSGECWGTRERDRCACNGNTNKCDFYPEKRKIKIDRPTALAVLKDLSKHMYPSCDLFGTDTLVINRTDFEVVRKKYLDRIEEETNEA